MQSQKIFEGHQVSRPGDPSSDASISAHAFIERESSRSAPLSGALAATAVAPDEIAIGGLFEWFFFIAAFVLLMVFDSVCLLRGVTRLTLRQSALYVLFYFLCAVGFWGFIAVTRGVASGFQWSTGYLLEWMLSVDNLFVYRVIFEMYKCPDYLQQKPLFVGIIGVIVLRLLLFVVGEYLYHSIGFVYLLLGAFLIYTGVKVAVTEDDDDEDPTQGRVIQWLAKRVPLVSYYDADGRFFVQVPKNGTYDTCDTGASGASGENVHRDSRCSSAGGGSAAASGGHLPGKMKNSEVELRAMGDDVESPSSSSYSAREAASLTLASASSPESPSGGAASTSGTASASTTASSSSSSRPKGASSVVYGAPHEPVMVGASAMHSSSPNDVAIGVSGTGESAYRSGGGGEDDVGDSTIDSDIPKKHRSLVRRFPYRASPTKANRVMAADELETRCTMSFLVACCLAATDVVFAIDSASAIIAQIPDIYLAYTACAFATLGLRATFFMVSELIALFSLLKYGVGFVLVFTGGKLMLQKWIYIPDGVTACVLLLTFVLSIAGSWLLDKMRSAPGSQKVEGTFEDAQFANDGGADSEEQLYDTGEAQLKAVV